LRLQFNGFSPLSACLIGIIGGVALAIMITLPRLQQLNSTHSQHYGNALASMAANQAIDASFNHDLVRLQVILRDVMENPYTRLATLHDVENNLLVQAGDTRSLTDATQSYTAPIVLHDSIAGYLSVTIEDKPTIGRTRKWFAVLLIATLLTLVIGDCYRCKSFQYLPIKKSDDEKADDERESSENDIAQQQALAALDALPKVYAIIHIKNLAVLNQQLNGESFRKTLSTVQHTISDVLALYNGTGYELEGDLIRLCFAANDTENEALFRAACSAWLIVELASITNNIPLDLAAFVSANHLDLAPANLPIAGLVLESHAASDDLIRRRLQFLEVGALDGRKVVAGFQQPFQSLLERQRAQLSSL